MPTLPDLQGLGQNIDKRLDNLEEGIKYTDISSTGATVTVGGFEKGFIANNMSFQQFADKLLHPYVRTSNVRLSLRLSNNQEAGTIYEVGNGLSLSSGVVSWTKGSTPVTIARIIRNSDNIATQNVSSDTGSVSLTFSTAVSINDAGSYVFSCDVYDNNGATQIIGGSDSINVVYPYYYGVTSKETQSAAEISIDSLTKVLTTSKTNTFSFNMSDNCAVFAYPSSIGRLTSIKDPNGFECLNTFSLYNANISAANSKSVEYLFYVSSVNTASGYKFIFKI